MDFYLVKLLEHLVEPPGLNLVAACAGLLLMPHRRRLGFGVIVGSLLALYLFSIPEVASPFVHSLERYPPVSAADLAADGPDAPGAIVVLGGGVNDPAPEYDGATVGSATLVRVRYAARLYRRTGLPVLVSGGSVLREGPPEAELMRRTLIDDFQVPVRWVEGRSRNTAENAAFSRDILAGAGVRKVVLVTDAVSMPRAVQCFHQTGLAVVPAPTYYHLPGPGGSVLFDWLPNAGALALSATATHEYLGMLWYWIRY